MTRVRDNHRQAKYVAEVVMGSIESMAERSEEPSEWDVSQQAALGLQNGQHGVIVGAPGSGKTEILLRLYADRVLRDGLSPDQITVLSPTRLSATHLRATLDARLKQPSTGARARTSTSLAVQMVTTARSLAGQKPPRLLTGASQDQLIESLLATEQVLALPWPGELTPDVRALRGFRNQLRELIRVCVDYRITTQELLALGNAHNRPEWVACAQLMPLYWEAAAERHPGELDLSQFHRAAADLLDSVTTGVDRASILGEAARLQTIFIDDAHELTRSSIELLAAFARRGVSIVAAGDPDITTGAFQGAEPEFLAQMKNFVADQRVHTFELMSVYRHGSTIRELIQRVSGAIGAAGWGIQRAAPAVREESQENNSVLLGTVPSGSQEAAAIARLLREQHLGAGSLPENPEPLEWSKMAVICRSRGQAAALAEALVALDVPTSVTAGGTVLRDHTIVRDLVFVSSIALGETKLDSESLARLLRGPLCGLDHIALRRLRAALLHEERMQQKVSPHEEDAPSVEPAEGAESPVSSREEDARRERVFTAQIRSADELLLEAFLDPQGFLTIDTEAARRAEKLQKIMRATRLVAHEGSIEEILWAAWDASQLSRVWEKQALGSTGIVADEANRSLDAVVALFFAAQRYEERSPGSDPRAFITLLMSSDLPEDTLAPRARQDCVTVTTPNGVIGRSFDLVIVSGVQEGVWPNLRLRGSLLAVTSLIELCERGVTGTGHSPTGNGSVPVVDATSTDTHNRRTVLHDELRMFNQALSRATSRVVIVAVDNEDSFPSRFFNLVPGEGPQQLPSGTLSLRGMVGTLRSNLEAQLVNSRKDSEMAGSQDVSGEAESRDFQVSAAALALLSRHGIAGAHPEEWYGILPPSSNTPLVDLTDESSVVSVSPSRLETLENCELDWAIGFLGGGDTSAVAGLGTLVHRALEHEQTPNVSALMVQVDAGWNALSFDAEWEERRMHERARQMVVRLVEYLGAFERAHGRLLTAEQSFRVISERVRLSGAIDRIEIYPPDPQEESDMFSGRVVIVDLKTGNPGVTAKTVGENAQLSAYQLALESGALEGIPAQATSGGAKLIVVSPDLATYKSVEQAPLSPQELSAFRGRLASAAERMAGASFHANIARHCSNPHNFGLCTLHTVRAVSFR
ncbi:UrvD/REP family ATP-dependent DNA helicase [Lysinibacter sp. HNR]|uniref:UrvD/REP family ATP-dependent DNA helicase n=1 Tax=Lysinibacter sp. HNR TaxID=3031408 RepID=UPI002435B2F3|nr:UrvD/REP family ATP-dependent DNA helicase [Lysinibacter sp. HNR]WGD36384.1 PD-(D/E)XK nuclease family protein [Lysinibacter sp. HNR]